MTLSVDLVEVFGTHPEEHRTHIQSGGYDDHSRKDPVLVDVIVMVFSRYWNGLSCGY